jgi:hypothetical protein
VHAHDLDVLDCSKRAHHLAQPPRRQDEWIAAGEDHFPDVVMGADVIERGVKLRARECLPLARPDHLAAKTEAAIHRTHMHQFQQHAIRIAMHDAFDRAVRIVADRIGAFALARPKLGRIGHELARDRIIRIGWIDQRCDIGRQRHRIACGDLFQLAKPLGRSQPRCCQRGRVAQAGCGVSCHEKHPHSSREDVVSPAGSVQRRSAPSVRRHAGRAHHLAPIGDFAFEIGVCLGEVLEDRIEPDLRQLRLHVGRLHQRVDLAVELENDRI